MHIFKDVTDFKVGQNQQIAKFDNQLTCHALHLINIASFFIKMT